MATQETFKERRRRRDREMFEALIRGESEQAYLALLDAANTFGRALAERIAGLPEDRRVGARGYAALLFSRAVERGSRHVDPRESIAVTD